MSKETTPAAPPIGVEFGRLLSATVDAVALAQEQLDLRTEERARAFQAAEDGTLAVPPLWFAFNRVALELEMSATVAGGQTGDGRLFCRTADATMVGLYGYEASAGVRVRLLMGPRGPLTIKDAGTEPAEP
ncbi:MAG TPA: hypothetical protein VF092_10550 [Longimicrobium sp.]